jgi:hypothetical protein
MRKFLAFISMTAYEQRLRKIDTIMASALERPSQLV